MVCLCSSNRERRMINSFAPPTTQGHWFQKYKKNLQGKVRRGQNEGVSLNEYINYRAHRGVIKNGLGSEKMQIKEMKPVIFSFMWGKSCSKMNCFSRRDSLNLCLQTSSWVNESVFFVRWLELRHKELWVKLTRLTHAVLVNTCPLQIQVCSAFSVRSILMQKLYITMNIFSIQRLIII